MRLAEIALVLSLGVLPATARAQAPESVGTSAAPQDDAVPIEERPGLELRGLPVESRTDVADFVGRNLPGASLGPHGLLLRGGDAGDTALLVDGLRVRHLALPLGLADRLEVATAGYGASWADVAGGTVSLTTRRESDRWQVGGELFHDFRDRVVTDAAASASGPIVRDRLFFLVGVEGAVGRDPVVLDPNFGRPPQEQDRALAGALKLSWLVNARHRIDSLTIIDGDRTDNGQSVLVQPEAQPTFSTRTLFSSLRWRGLFGNALVAGVSAGASSGTVRESPMSCRWDPQHCEEIAPIRDVLENTLRQNALRRETQRDRGLELEGHLDAFLWQDRPIDEHLQVASRMGLRAFTSDTRVPGDTVFTVAGASTGPIPLHRDELAPNHATSSSLRTVHALESTTRFWRRLSVTPGLALVTSHASNSGGVELDDVLVTPHAAALWDVRGDGRWLVRASTHRRVDADLERFARFALPLPVQNRCLWDQATNQYGQCQLLGGASPPVDDVSMPRTWEHTAGVERTVGPYRLGLDAIYRRTTGFAAGSSAPGFPQAVVNVPDWYTRYRGVTASASKRNGPAQLFLAYTLSRHDAGRDLPDDRRHVLQALASYDLFGHGWVSGIFTWASGRPAYPTSRGHVSGIFEDYPESRVTDPQLFTPPEPEAPARAPAVKRLNLQGRLRAKRLLKVDLELWADVINVFDWGRVTVDAPLSFQPIVYRLQEGRSVRLGLEYRY